MQTKMLEREKKREVKIYNLGLLVIIFKCWCSIELRYIMNTADNDDDDDPVGEKKKLKKKKIYRRV